MSLSYVRRITPCWLCLFAASGWGPSLAAETILLEDNFDAENGGAGIVNYAGFANFNVTGGSVDLIGNGFADFFPGNGLYVDLDGTTTAGATFESSTAFDLEPGRIYTIQFDLGNPDQRFGGGSTNNTMTLSLGTAFSESFARDGLSEFETIVREVSIVAPQTARLAFVQDGGDDLGMLIDNVSLTSVPEPTASLLVAFLAGARFAGRGRAP